MNVWPKAVLCAKVSKVHGEKLIKPSTRQNVPMVVAAHGRTLVPAVTDLYSFQNAMPSTIGPTGPRIMVPDRMQPTSSQPSAGSTKNAGFVDVDSPGSAPIGLSFRTIRTSPGSRGTLPYIRREGRSEAENRRRSRPCATAVWIAGSNPLGADWIPLDRGDGPGTTTRLGSARRPPPCRPVSVHRAAWDP